MIFKIKEKIYQSNVWYDRQPDPNRFLYFILLVMICYIPSFILIFFGITGDLVTVLPTLLLMPVGIVRYIYICKK